MSLHSDEDLSLITVRVITTLASQHERMGFQHLQGVCKFSYRLFETMAMQLRMTQDQVKTKMITKTNENL